MPEDFSDSGTVGRAVRHRTLHPLVRALVWGAAYLVAGEIGLATAVEGEILTLASPAAGVAALWFVTGSRRTWVWDAPVLAIASASVSAQLDVSAELIVVSAIANVVAVGVVVAVVRTWSADLAGVGGGGSRTLWHLGDLAVLLAAAALGSVISAGAPTLGQALADLPTGDLQTFLLRWARNAAAVLAITSLGLLLLPVLRRPLTARSVVRRFLPGRPHGALELATLALFTFALYAFIFSLSEDLPVVFVLFLATAWGGARFPLPTIATQAVLTGALAVVFTLQGNGPFAHVDDTVTGVLLAQLFVLVSCTTALVIGISRAEVTEAERLADERAQLLDSVLGEVGDGIVVIDQHERVLVLNLAGHEILGIGDDPERARTSGRHQLYLPDGTLVTDEQLPHLRALRGDELDGELLHVQRPGEPGHRVVRVSAHLLPHRLARAPAHPLDDEDRVLVVYRDVTADQLHRDALTSFAGHVAHDLRNPLTVIEGWAGALTDAFESRGQVSAEAGVGMTRRIEGAAGRMREFIRELLDFTLARDQSLRPAEVAVGDVAEEVVTLLEGRSWPGGGPDLRVDAPGTAYADRGLVRIVLDNLVGNACKYVAPDTRPRVVVSTREVDDDWLEVAVVDNGIGVPAAERSLVFESFHRVPQEGYAGTGLGLAICRRIVERHGGEIRVEDDAATGGSRFVFTLPRSATVLERHAPAATSFG